MKIRSRITKLIAIAMAVAAIAVIGSIFKTEAQEVRVFRGTVLAGFIPGESLRFSIANLRPEKGGGPIRAQVRLFDAQGNVLKSSAEVEVLPGQFHTVRFDRADLPLTGEEVTGRVQVRGEIILKVAASPEQIRPEEFPIVIELVNNAKGDTNIHTHGLHISGDGNADNVIDR